MIKTRDTDALFNKFKTKYRVIFSNKFLKKICENHFDYKMGFAAFTIGLVENQLGEKRALRIIEINSSNWIKVLSDIYDDKQIIGTFKALTLNPIILFENIEESFDCFNVVINTIVHFFNSEQLDLKIHENQLKYLLKSAFGFIMYNCIDCKIHYHLKDILSDPEYDQKLTIILNNTKLFAKAKNAILSNCGLKISDLIQLLLGISRELNHNK